MRRQPFVKLKTEFPWYSYSKAKTFTYMCHLTGVVSRSVLGITCRVIAGQPCIMLRWQNYDHSIFLMEIPILVSIQYIPRNMHTVFALLCFVVVIHWLIFPYPSGLLHWHCGNLTIAPVPAKQPWWIWINTSCEFIINDWITTTRQSTTKPSAYFLGYTVRFTQKINHVCRRCRCTNMVSLNPIMDKW